MPTYRYRCKDCGKTTTKDRKMSARKDPVTCKCGSTDSEILIGRTGFVLKGGGWYATDYKVNKGKKK